MIIKIALIDSHPIMRKGLAIVLHEYFKEVKIYELDNTDGFADLHLASQPDLVILGLNTNNKKTCLEIARNLKRQISETPLIVYDENETLNLTIPYFKSGVNGYLLKKNNASEMINCLKTVLSGKFYICPVLTQLLFKHLIMDGKVSSKKPEVLTTRELEIAAYLCEGMGTSMIAKKLERKASTISTIKNSIFRKMRVDNIIDLRKQIPVNPLPD